MAATHLLAALLLEEGVASEYLTSKGIHLDQLRSTGSEHWHPAWESSGTAVDFPPHGDDLREIIQRARNRSHSGGRPTETDTLDLLAGLLELNGSAARYLAGFGITTETFLQDDSSERTGSGQALPMDENLRWESQASSERMSLLRIADSSLNRLREGIRVVEEYVRFQKNDSFHSAWIKRLRHSLADACRELPPADLLAARDTEHDVGTEITLDSELSRDSLEDVLLANLKRCQEGSRTLEEYGKLLSPAFAARLKHLRYELYTFEKSLRSVLAVGTRRMPEGLYLLVSEELCLRGSGPVIRGALTAGVRIIQIREKQMPDRKLIEHARRVRDWTREHEALLIINDRPDLAVLVEADGVHVGQEELSVADARKIVGPRCFVGVSTHSLEQARQAVRDGADSIGVGPVFPSKTKSFDSFVGLELVRDVSRSLDIPAYAIGGIGPANIDSVIEAGARGIAVSSAICSAQDPERAARDLTHRLETTGIARSVST